MTEYASRPELEDRLLRKLDALEVSRWIGGTAEIVSDEFCTSLDKFLIRLKMILPQEFLTAPSYALSVYRKPESPFDSERKLFEFTGDPRIEVLFRKLQDRNKARVQREYERTLQELERLL